MARAGAVAVMMAHARVTLYRLLMSDTAMVRLILAIVASMWAVLLWVPGGEFATTRVGTLFGHVAPRNGEMIWAGTWTLLAALKFWRICDPAERPLAALLVNSFSTVMFTSSVAAAYLTHVALNADLADDIGMVLASLWVLIRTSVGNHSVVRE